MESKKNRDGPIGKKLTYLWDIDRGKFEWLPSADDSASEEKKRERKEEVKREYKKEGKVVF